MPFDPKEISTISGNFMAGFKRANLTRRNADEELCTEFKFKIGKSDTVATITIIDADGNTVDAADCRGANSAQQRVLSCMQSNSRVDFDFEPGWDNYSSKTILIANVQTMIPSLLQCDGMIVDDELKPVKISTEVASIVLEIKPKGDKYISRILAELPDKARPAEPLFIGDSHILAGRTIYPIPYIGDNINRINLFSTTISADYLDCFLSIFYTYTENVGLSFEGYSEQLHRTPVTPEPVVFFEKVDEDNSLYMHLVTAAATLPANFTVDFNISRVAHVDNNVVHINPLADININAIYSDFNKKVNQSAPNAAARKQIYIDNGFYILPHEVASSFLLNTLLSLSSKYRLAGIENIKQYKIYPVKPKLSFKVSSGIDYLEGDLTVEIEDRKYSLKDILDEYRRNNCIKLKDGNRGIVDGNYLERLANIFRPVKGTDKVAVSFFDLPEVDNMLEQRINNDVFNRSREVYKGFNDIAKSEFRLPEINATLRDYQVQGVKWMNYLRTNNLGGCLADDMGLGKTLQTITLLRSIYPESKKPSLVVMPKSLIFNWQAEIDKFAPGLKYYVYYETTRDINKAMEAEVILTTYAMVRNDIEDLMKVEFEYVILDESQSIKNVNAQVSNAVKLLKADHRLALSGTPIENNLTELYSLFSFLNPAMFGTLEDFNQRYVNPIQKDGDETATELLRRKIYPFILRRLKRDVLVQLPERIDQRCYVEMTPAHAGFYEERRLYYKEHLREQLNKYGIGKTQTEIFKALNELRRIASIPESINDDLVSPKLEPMLDNVIQAVENGHKVVIFFNYLAGIESVGEHLTTAGIDYVTITGATQKRGEVVNRFQTDRNCRVILMTLKTGGVGINLTAADIVYIFEPWWNPAAEEQAISRLHRMGQHNTVFSYSMITRGTIEEKICKLQEQKQQLFDDLISSDSSISKHLTAEDIDFILS